MKRTISFASLLLIIIISCQPPKQNTNEAAATPASNNNNPLLETKWELIELGGNTYIKGSAPKQPFLLLSTLDNRVSGIGGCNSITGTYTLDGMRIKFSKMASTMMACANGMDIEQKMSKVLEEVDNYTISGDSILSLNKTRMASLARFRKPKL